MLSNKLNVPQMTNNSKLRLCFLALLLAIICQNVMATGYFEVPNLSALRTDNVTRYIYVVAVLDLNATNAYQGDHLEIRNAVSESFYAANTYFYQMNYIIIISDVITMNKTISNIKEPRYFLKSLRNGHKLPFYNIMVFFYQGSGYTWDDKLCDIYKSIIVVQQNVFNPKEMAFDIMLRFSRLVGIVNSTPVPKCSCKNGDHQCLRVPGLTKNCSLQALTDKLQNTTCLPRKPRTVNDDKKEGQAQTKAPGSLGPLSLCGNEIVEIGEDCDCGFDRYCFDEIRKNPCNQKTCLWDGSKQISTDEGDSCTCTIVKQILGQLCGTKKCHLTDAIFRRNVLIGGILFTMLVFFCCCCICCYRCRRNPEVKKNTRKMQKSPVPPQKPKDCIEGTLTPTRCAPPPPVKIPNLACGNSRQKQLDENLPNKMLLIKSQIQNEDNTLKPTRSAPPPPVKMPTPDLGISQKNQLDDDQLDPLLPLIQNENSNRSTLRPTRSPPPPPVKIPNPKPTGDITRQNELDDDLPPPPSNIYKF